MTKGPLKERREVRNQEGAREGIQCYFESRQNSQLIATDVDSFTEGKHRKGTGSRRSAVCSLTQLSGKLTVPQVPPQ